MEIRDRIFEIIAEQGNVDIKNISESSNFQDLGIDSLGLVEVIFAIEEAFDITIPFNANSPEESELDISSVGSVIKAIQSLVDNKS